MKKKNLVLQVVVILTILMTGMAVLIVLRIKKLGTRPVAPTVPESKPEAVEEIPDKGKEACTLNLVVEEIATATPTLAPTSTPSPTPIVKESSCEYLKVDKTSGIAPLLVTFEGKGFDSDNKIKGFKFVFGDGEERLFTGTYTNKYTQSVSHTYEEQGVYNAFLQIMSSEGEWKTSDSCKVKIEVKTEQVLAPTLTPTPSKVPTATPTVKPTVVVTEKPQPTPTEVVLPQAGVKEFSIGGIVLGLVLLSLGIVLIF